MSTLSAEQMHVSYRNGPREVAVLRGVTISFATGKLTTIQGASGSGKSTLLHTLGGLGKPDAGRVLLDGASLYDLSQNALSRTRNARFGFVFQAYHLLPELTALENVLLPARIARKNPVEKARLLLEEMGLTDRAEHRPSELSGGEQQRVAIARALVNDPDILLADEPTGNLDAKSGTAVLDCVLQIQSARQLTAILVTHDDRIAGAGHVRLRLADGELTPTCA